MRIRMRVSRLIDARAPTAKALRVRALWALLSDRTASGREQMVRLFQSALALEPALASRRNDLAAAYLIRASFDEESSDLPEALDLLESISGTRQLKAVVLVNRAYALQCLTLWHEAMGAWRQLPVPEALENSSLTRSLAQPSVRVSRKEALTDKAQNDPLAVRQRGEWLLGE